MYRFKFSPSLFEELSRLMESYPSIENKLLELEANPYAIAIETNMQAIGEYYVNAGRHCILFDVDEEEKIVSLLKVVPRPYLHKVITGKISAEL